MEKILKNKVSVSKKGTEFVISDRKTGKSLQHIIDTPIYDMFELDHPFLSGIGSAFNVAGNYYSFRRYLSTNDDYSAIRSDWRKVGAAFLEVLSSLKEK